MKKNIFFLLCIAKFINMNATLDDTQGFYKANNPYFPYLNYGSSYYLNVADDFSWNGKSWIFKTGYRHPARRCGGGRNYLKSRYNHVCK